MARWLVVKVMDEEHFDAQYKLNQLDGVDCMEVPEGRLPQWIPEAFDGKEERQT